MYLEFEREVNKALEGDKEAKLWILEQLKPLIASHSKRYGGQNGWDEDLYQEGALQILEALEQFDKDRGIPFLGYITIRIKHYYQNKRRKEKELYSLDQPVGEGDESTLLDLLEDSQVAIEGDYLKKEEQEALCRSLSMLSKKEREMIEDYYLRGEQLKNIAKKRGVHYITASKQKNKALKKLERLLDRPLTTRKSYFIKL